MENTIVRGKLTPLKTCFSQTLTICAKWLRKGASNMAMIDVAMVSGFVPNEKSLNKVIFASPSNYENNNSSPKVTLAFRIQNNFFLVENLYSFRKLI